MSKLPIQLGALRGWHRPLLVNVTLMYGLALVSAVGMVIDDRVIMDESVWLKPLKFGFAIGTYSLTLSWLLTKLTKGRRLGWWLGALFAVAATLDVGAVAFAAAHGTFSHFNQDTDPAARTVQTIFDVGVLPLLLVTLVVSILILIQRTGDRPTSRALRFGLGLAAASMAVAGWLSGSSGGTPRTVTDADGRPVSLIGGHGIGDPDGHGMPVTGWSSTGGDLRVPHFAGLHAIQILLLVTAILALLANRVAWLRDENVRARLVGIAGLGYTGVFAVLTWQAKRGQSLIHPDRQTLVALATVALLALLAATAVTAAARRRPSGRRGVRLPGRPEARRSAGAGRDRAVLERHITVDADGA
jgi:hypothetical protein